MPWQSSSCSWLPPWATQTPSSHSNPAGHSVRAHHAAIALHPAVVVLVVVVLAVMVTAVTVPVVMAVIIVAIVSVPFPAVDAVVIVMACTGRSSTVGRVRRQEPHPGEVVQAEPRTDPGGVLDAGIHPDGLLAGDRDLGHAGDVLRPGERDGELPGLRQRELRGLEA